MLHVATKVYVLLPLQSACELTGISLNVWIITKGRGGVDVSSNNTIDTLGKDHPKFLED